MFHRQISNAMKSGLLNLDRHSEGSLCLDTTSGGVVSLVLVDLLLCLSVWFMNVSFVL